MRSKFGRCLILTGAFAAGAHARDFGRIIDPVLCAADPEQRYVLYVPSHYSDGRAWPAIFCFDPGARGRIPVERLQAAAEKYGFIIAASLTSRNGPWEANARAAQAMIRDVSSRYALDPRRLYTAGLSGGARVATGLALSGVSHGVIACGAGFPSLPEGLPVRVPFPFFGTTGTEDFNHAELWRLDAELGARSAAYRIVEFDGGHEWAPPALLTEAVEWLELEAMRTGLRATDPAFVQSMLQARLVAMPPQPGPERWRCVKSIATDFRGLADTGGFEHEAQTLGASPAVKAGLKAERALAVREEALVDKLEHTAFKGPARQRAQADEINRIAERAEDSAERRMVRRARAGFIAMTRERLNSLLSEGQYDTAVDLLEMADALKPRQPRTLFDLARARALNRDREQALATLERAVVAGFSDSDRARTEPAFEKLRNDTRFLATLAQMGDQPATSFIELPVMRVSAALASVELRPFYLPNAGGAELPLSFLRVEHVAPRSAAAQAGLEPGMEVTSIQGIRMRSLGESDLEKIMMLTAREEIILTVRLPPAQQESEIRVPLKKSATFSVP